MARSFIYSALVLRVRSSGESNREAFFLTAEEGLVRATVFGGPKSKLRAHVAPFHRGTLWVYHDPVRDSRKVSDFDVQLWRPGIRESYERTMAASSLAETILAAYGGGGGWSGGLLRA
ncbi:MAG: recombination protein O N-terminal domain-containing protein, partial [Treponema sp.]|nr:recombination protein O N-terminal domain-containing protein [Treponema sp.]